MKKTGPILVALFALSINLGFQMPTQAARHVTGGQGNRVPFSREEKQTTSTSNYLGNLKMEIASNWNPPRGNASTWGVVYFKLDSYGYCRCIKLVKSTGNKDIDRSFMDGIESSSPFGNLPNRRSSMGFNVAFHYYPESQTKSLTQKQYRDQISYLDNLDRTSKTKQTKNRPETFSTICTFIDSSSSR